MKIGLIGFGKMGREVQKMAQSRNHQVICIIDPVDAQATSREITAESLQGVDVCIDFSSPKSARDNVALVSTFGKGIVMGTTGWYDQLEQMRKEIIEKKGKMVYASNFSIGVNVFFRIVEESANMMSRFPAYDVGGFEMHHNQKADSPSGTAKTLAEILKKNTPSKKSIVYDLGNRKIGADELHFSSVRVGATPGTHHVFFDSGADTIQLIHTARNREGFALGAVMAAEWLEKKNAGFYTVSDWMSEIIKGDEKI